MTRAASRGGTGDAVYERRNIDTVIFDVGDTLLDFGAGESRRQLTVALRQGYDYLQERGIALPSFKRYASVLRRGLILRLIWSRIVTRRELKCVPAIQSVHRGMGLELDPETAAEVAHRCYAAMGLERTADPGARETLEELRACGYRLGIISNSFAPPGGLDQHLAEEGLLRFFEVRVYSADVGYMKPHPRIFELALERLGTAAARAIYVGDKEHIDVKGASRLGMVTVLKRCSKTSAPRRSRANHVIEGLGELPAIVRGYPTDVHPADAPSGLVRV